MEVNINKLPIPAWNLACPACGYCLNGLTSHRCPECGTEFDMASIVQPHARVRDPEFTGNESPLPDFGLTCHACHEPLAGATSAACPHCGRLFDKKASVPRKEWFQVEPWMCFGIPIEIVALLLDEAFVPYIPLHGRNALAIGSMQLSVATEFFFDMLYLTRQRANGASTR